MFDALMIVLYVAVIVVALLLIALVLIQPSKSGGFGSVFGGVGESVFGAYAGSHLSKATVVLTVIFFVLALTLASLIGHQGSRENLVAAVADQPAAEVPVDGAFADHAVSPAADAPATAPAETPAK